MHGTDMLDVPREDVPDRRLTRLVAVSPGSTPSSTTPHMPSTTASSRPSRMSHVLVPMIATNRPGSVTPHDMLAPEYVASLTVGDRIDDDRIFPLVWSRPPA
jgi:hypothetical protein